MANIVKRLEAAVQNGKLEEVKELLGSINCQSQLSKVEKHNMLRKSMDLKHTEVAKLLIEKGFEPNYETVKGDVSYFYGKPTRLPGFPLIYNALQFNDVELVKLLVDMETYNFNAVPTSSLLIGSPLHFALTKEMGREVIELLLKRGLDCNADGPFGTKPIQKAARTGNIGALEALLQHGAEVDAAGGLRVEINDSALNIAVKRGDADMVKLLLMHGADPNNKTADEDKKCSTWRLAFFTPTYNLTPLDVALKKGRIQIAQLLIEHGGKTGSQS